LPIPIVCLPPGEASSSVNATANWCAVLFICTLSLMWVLHVDVEHLSFSFPRPPQLQWCWSHLSISIAIPLVCCHMYYSFPKISNSETLDMSL
jgi:hypothetical protein